MTSLAAQKVSSGPRDNRFVAEYSDDASLHFLKSQQLAEVARTTGQFVAPEPLAISDSKKKVTWEWIADLHPIRKALPELAAHVQTEIASQIGKTLAAIHGGLELAGDTFSPEPVLAAIEDSKLRELCADVVARGPISNIHGDFACANLFLDTESRIVTLDPEPNIYLFHQAAADLRASIYLELGLAVQSLCSRPDFTQAMRGRLDAVCVALIDGYEEQSGIAIDRAAVYAFASAVMRIYRVYRHGDGIGSWFDRFIATRFRKNAGRKLLRIAQDLASD